MNEVKIFLLKHPIKLILDQQPARTSAHYCHWFQNLLFFDVKRKLVSRLNYIEYRYYMSMSSTLFNQTEKIALKYFYLWSFMIQRYAVKSNLRTILFSRRSLFQEDFVEKISFKNIFVWRSFLFREDFFKKIFCSKKIFVSRRFLYQENFLFREHFFENIIISRRFFVFRRFCSKKFYFEKFFLQKISPCVLQFKGQKVFSKNSVLLLFTQSNNDDNLNLHNENNTPMVPRQKTYRVQTSRVANVLAVHNGLLTQ